MNCVNLKIRTRKGVKYGYCTIRKCDVPIFGCKCDSIEYKKVNHKPVRKNSRIAKLERNRFSILTDNLSVCIVCGKPRKELHEIYEGIFRERSMTYGCVIPLCTNCHRLIHSNHELALKYKMLCESKFSECYPNLEFCELFYYKR